MEEGARRRRDGGERGDLTARTDFPSRSNARRLGRTDQPRRGSERAGEKKSGAGGGTGRDGAGEEEPEAGPGDGTRKRGAGRGRSLEAGAGGGAEPD